MFFNKNSGIVKVWVGNVLNDDSPYEYKDVPKLLNLREVVKEVLIESGVEFEDWYVAIAPECWIVKIKIYLFGYNLNGWYYDRYGL